MRIYLLLLISLATFSCSFVNAQCPLAGTLYGTAVAPTTSCSAAQASPGCHFASSTSGDYASFSSLVSGSQYRIVSSSSSGSTSPNTDELTVYLSTNTAAGNHVAYGTGGSVTFTPNAAGTYIVVINVAGATCGTANSTCRYLSIECLSCAPPAPTTTQPATTAVTGGTLNNQILRLNAPVCGQTVTQIDFATTGSTNPATDIAAAKVYYTTSTTFATTTQFGSTVVAPNGSFIVTGSQAVAATGYFWLVYDLNCGAVGANVIDAECVSFTANATPYTLSTPNPAGTRSITAATSTATTTQPTTATVTSGTNDNQVLRVQVTSCAGVTVTELNLATTGSTNPSTDITSAKVYFTTSTTFSTTTPFGSAFSSPNGAFTITGSQILTSGTGYFWLVYDVPTTATNANVLDASCSNVVVGGSSLVPSTQNPTGTRTIVSPPANDLCSNATALNCGTSNLAGTTVGAILETHGTGCSMSGYGVWYSFVGDGISNTISVTTTSFDSEMAIASGSCGALTNVTCNDNAGSSGTETHTFVPTNGVTYYVYVGHFSTSGTTTGNFTISRTCAACPAPTALSASSITSTSASLNWTENGSSTTWDIEWGPTGFTQGSGTLISGTSTKPYALSGLSPSTAYQFYVRATCGGSWSSVGSFTTIAPPPSNDESSGALSVSVNADYNCGSTTSGTLSGATGSPENTTACFGTEDDDVWFSFTASNATHRVSLTNVTPSTDMYHSVWTGTPGSLTLVSGSCSDPDISNPTGLVSGTTYYIRVYSYGTTSGLTTTFDVCVGTPPPPPSNDDCGTPVNINGGGTPGAPTGAPISGTTLGATASGYTTTCGGTANDDVFFEFVSDSDGGQVNITVAGGTGFDAVVELTQTCGGANLACEDNTLAGETEVLTFTCLPSTGYRVRVYDYFTNFTGGAGDRAAGTFTIAAAGAALPVTLTKFTAKSMDKSNMIEWTTANERNTQWHVVERSKDGISNWEKVGHVEAQGTTSQETSYQMEDKTPFALTYYRLRSIDFDGHEDRSSIVQVTRKSGVFGVTSVYPSPTTDALNVQFESTEETNVTIQIFDLNGRLVLEQQHGAVKGINMKQLSLASLASGTYSLHLLTDSIISGQVKVIKQ